MSLFHHTFGPLLLTPLLAHHAVRVAEAHESPGFEYGFPHHASSLAMVDTVPLPPDLVRVEQPLGSYAEWVRHLPMEPEVHGLLDWQGAEVLGASYTWGIFDLDVRRYQECADIAMRLWAEYVWAMGGRPKMRLENGRSNPRQDAIRSGQRKTLDAFLTTQFLYASSNVLKRDLQAVPIDDVQPGDVLVLRKPGSSQGHVFLIVDVAVHRTDGRKKVAVAQGNIPAQSFHGVPNPPPYVGWESYHDEFSSPPGETRYRCWMDWITFYDATENDENGRGALRRFPSR